MADLETRTQHSISFTDDLENRARRIVHMQSNSSNRPDATHVMVQEIALVLNQIAQHRLLDQRLRHDLVDVECSIGTELMQMEQRTPRYSPYRFPEREKFQRQLHRIGEERRRLAMSHEQHMQGLHNRLVGLVARHELLAQYDDGR